MSILQVLWFEDSAALDALKDKNPAIQGLIPECMHPFHFNNNNHNKKANLCQGSAHSSGMHQFITWTALNNEGLACNLQHYNFSTTFVENVHKIWNIPSSWKLQGQLVFGQPEGAGPEKEKEIKPVEGERVLVFQ